MTRRSLERRLLSGVLALFALPAMVAAAALYLLHRRRVFRAPATLAASLAVGGLTLMAYLAVVTYGLGRVLVGHLRTIRRGVELIATANPDHRIALRPRAELATLRAEATGLG